MADRDRFHSPRVDGEADRRRALEVPGDVDLREQGWFSDPDQVFPPCDLDDTSVSSRLHRFVTDGWAPDLIERLCA